MITFADRVKETALVSGTMGDYALGGAVTGFQGFVTAIGNGKRCCYCAEKGSSWEVGEGTITASGSTLSRDRILSSANSGVAVNWPAGSTVSIYCVAPAEVIQRTAGIGPTITTPGLLQAKSGTARWYPLQPVTFTAWSAWIGQPAAGAAVNFALRKCGAVVATGSITAGAQTMPSAAISITLIPSDWLTLDITQIGSITAGSDLTVRLIP